MKYYRIFIYFFLISVFFACEKPDVRLNEPNETLRPLAQFVHNNYSFSLLSAAIDQAGLTEELDSVGPFTVYAPTDDAFHRFGIKTAEDFRKWSTDSLRRFVQYHILRGKLPLEDVPEGTTMGSYTSMWGKEFFISRYSSTYVNGTLIGSVYGDANRYNIQVSNGIVHEISEVLKYEDLSVRQWLEKQEKYSIFVAGLKQFGYWDLLTDDKQWTIIAPSNEAFETEGITLEQVQALDPSRYGKRLFGAYIFNIPFYTSDYRQFSNRKLIRTLNDAGNGKPSYIFRRIIGDEAYSNGFWYDEMFVAKTLPLDKEQVPVGLALFPTYSNGLEVNVNYTTRNAVVHDIDEILLRPNQVLK